MAEEQKPENEDETKHLLITLEVYVDDAERLRTAMAEGKLKDLGIKRVRFLEPLADPEKKDKRRVELMKRLQPGEDFFRS